MANETRSDFRDALDEAQSKLMDAVAAFNNARSIANKAGRAGEEWGSWAADVLDGYTIPNLRAFDEDERQPGSVVSILNALDDDFAVTGSDETTLTL